MTDRFIDALKLDQGTRYHSRSSKRWRSIAKISTIISVGAISIIGIIKHTPHKEELLILEAPEIIPPWEQDGSGDPLEIQPTRTNFNTENMG